MKLPTEQECLDLFKKYKVPPNILEHCQAVRKVAVLVAERLQENKVEINVELVGRLALLHDLFKMAVIRNSRDSNYHANNFTREEIRAGQELRQKYPGMNEEQIAYLVFSRDYPELATAFKNKGNPERSGLTENIVHYADWRVLKDKVVSFSERLTYLDDTYPHQKEKYLLSLKKMQLFEEELKNKGINLNNLAEETNE